MLRNVEVADLIALHVTQLTTLLSELTCRLIKPIEIDYNFIEVEHQYLFDNAGKRFIKESGSLKGSPRAFIRYEYSESKKTNPTPFIESTHFHFAIFSNSNQLILKLNKGPKMFVCNFKISSQDQHFLLRLITPCHSLSHLVTPYPPGWTENHFHLATFKLVSRIKIFYHILSRLALLITPYPPGWTENHFHLAIFKLVPRLLILYHILSRLVTPYHTLSHLTP